MLELLLNVIGDDVVFEVLSVDDVDEVLAEEAVEDELVGEEGPVLVSELNVRAVSEALEVEQVVEEADDEVCVPEELSDKGVEVVDQVVHVDVVEEVKRSLDEDDWLEVAKDDEVEVAEVVVEDTDPVDVTDVEDSDDAVENVDVEEERLDGMEVEDAVDVVDHEDDSDAVEEEDGSADVVEGKPDDKELDIDASDEVRDVAEVVVETVVGNDVVDVVETLLAEVLDESVNETLLEVPAAALGVQDPSTLAVTVFIAVAVSVYPKSAVTKSVCFRTLTTPVTSTT